MKTTVLVFSYIAFDLKSLYNGYINFILFYFHDTVTLSDDISVNGGWLIIKYFKEFGMKICVLNSTLCQKF